MATLEPQRRDTWTRYWASGAAHSLSGSVGDALDGAVGEFWRAQVAAAPVPLRMLDIGTGNGALPRLALSLLTAAGSAEGARIDAIDLADVRPGAWATTAPVTFHARTAAEDLPFGAGMFDLATSQFGLEYASRGPALAELGRVLAAGGRLALLVHHAGSQLAAVAREELATVDWMLDAGGLLPVVRAMLEVLARHPGPEGRAHLARDPVAGAAREAFNAALRQADARLRSARVPELLREARGVVAGLLRTALERADAPAALAACGAWELELADARVRYRELLDAAVAPDALEHWRQLLSGNGFLDIEMRPFAHESGHLIAWAITATRAGGKR